MHSALPNKAELPFFQQKQLEFTACIRQQDISLCPADVDAIRMRTYLELFYNNVEGFIANSFPLLRDLYTDESWHKLVRDYFARHRSLTPSFPEMPREFLIYLQNEREPNTEDPPFMYELAHYDWCELALDIADTQIDMQGISTNAGLLDGVPVVSPLAWLLEYHFPVHRINADFQPMEMGELPTYLVMYRDPNDDVNTIEVNALTALLINSLNESSTLTGRELLAKIAGVMNHPQPEIIIAGGEAVLNDLYQRHVILGTRQI